MTETAKASREQAAIYKANYRSHRPCVDGRCHDCGAIIYAQESCERRRERKGFAKPPTRVHPSNFSEPLSETVPLYSVEQFAAVLRQRGFSVDQAGVMQLSKELKGLA